MAKIAIGEGITRSAFGVKGVDLGEEEAPYWTTHGKRESYKPRPQSDGIGARTPYYAMKDFLDCHLPIEWEIARDAEHNPFKDTLVFRRMVLENQLLSVSLLICLGKHACVERIPSGRSRDVCGMISDMMRQLPPKPSRQEDFEDLMINLTYNQEEKVKQLEEYMCVIVNDFIQLSSQVIERLKEEIKIKENEVKKIEKIMRDKRGTDPPIKPQSLDSFRMKVVDKSTINTPPSPHMASFHPKNTYSYYHPCIDDPTKHYRFKPGLLRQSGSLGVDLLKLEMIEDDWELKFKEVSFLGRGLNLPIKPKEVEKVRIKDTHHLEHIFQPLFLHMAPLHPNGVYRYYHPHLNLSVGEPSLLSVK
nr:hypothetical protein [Tanacetum cinerariifolium]